MPALRERASDIHLLTMFFVQKCAKKMGKQISSVSEEAMHRLTNYSWPGNIRELQNVIERAVILSPGKTLGSCRENCAAPGTVGPLALRRPAKAARPLESSKPRNPKIRNQKTKAARSIDVERRHIESVLNQTNWMIEGERGAAKHFGHEPQHAPQPDAKTWRQKADGQGLKARQMIAQGIALGFVVNKISSPERAKEKTL